MSKTLEELGYEKEERELATRVKNMIEFHEYEQPEEVYIKQCEREGLI